MASSILVSSILLCFLAVGCHSKNFDTLNKTLEVTASPKQGEVLLAGENTITVTWSINQAGVGVESSYQTVKAKLCYAPASQVDRPWRKTVNEVAKDKTCQHNIATQTYLAGKNGSVSYLLGKDIPTATYFVRVYVYGADSVVLGYGQTTNKEKTTDLFSVAGISGRHASLEIESACFSGFAIVSLFGFFYMEKRKGKASSSK